MATPMIDALGNFTDGIHPRPIPEELSAARRDVLATLLELRRISDADLTKPWDWIGGSEEEIRYGFYRIAESFELAGIDAETTSRSAGSERGRAGDLIGPASAARWDLHGLLIGLSDDAWDAEPGGGEWSIRRTLGHVISSQRAYGLGTAWWQRQAFRAGDPALPTAVPDELWELIPSEETEGVGTPTAVRARLDDVLDRSTERLAGLPTDRLDLGARWSGFAVDVAFRLGRWSSHLREHTIQVEKTLVVLGREPTEIDRLGRLVLAAWGRAESVVFGHDRPTAAITPLAAAASTAAATAADLRRVADTSPGADRV